MAENEWDRSTLDNPERLTPVPRSQRVLQRAITLSEGQFSLVLVRCNYGPLEQAWIDQLPRDEPLWEGLHWVHVLPELQDLLPPVAATAAVGQPTAVMVLGLGQVQALEAVLALANQLRDRFKGLQCPVVVWLSDGALEQFARLAPDLKSWAATPIAVEVSPSQLLEFLQGHTEAIVQRVLRPPGGYSLERATGDVTLGPGTGRELAAAEVELESMGVDCPPALRASLALVLGMETYGQGAIAHAQGLFEESARFWESLLGVDDRAVGRYCVAMYWISRCWAWGPAGGGMVQRSPDTQELQEGLGPGTREGWDRAVMVLREGLERSRNRDPEAWGDRCLVGPLGECLMVLRQWRDLETLAQEALVSHRTQKWELEVARDYRLLGEVALGRSQPLKAEEWFKQALGSVGHWGLPSEVAVRRGIYFWRLGVAQWRSRQGALTVESLGWARRLLDNQSGTEEPLLAVLRLLQRVYFSLHHYLWAFQTKQDLRLVQHRFGRLAFVGASQLQPQPGGGSEGPALGMAPELQASGRSQDVVNLIQRLGRNDHPLTVIHGRSGVGKSSIIRAGLVPELERRAVGDRQAVPVIVDRYTDWVMAIATALGVTTPWEPIQSPPEANALGGPVSTPPAFRALQTLNPSKLVVDAAAITVAKMGGPASMVAPVAGLMERWQQWESLPLPVVDPEKNLGTPALGINASLAQTILDQVRERLRHNADHQYLTVLIFDQFEELFLTWPRPQDRQVCFEFLRDCLNLPYVKLVFSMREDYLHFLLDWERSLALTAVDNNVLDRQVRYSINDFSPADAIATINGLMERSQFSLESQLIQELVQNLALESGRVNPIELQVVGAQLQADRVTTLSAYKREYGSKNQVVERYLRRTIRDCGPLGEAIAWQVLFLLTAENGTRPLKNRSELETEVGTTGERLDTVLQILEGAGVILVFRDRTSWLYQLVHDYLTSYIRQERQETERARFRLTQSQLNRVLKRRVRELYGAGSVLTLLLMSSLGLALSGAAGKTEALVQAMIANADFVMGNSNQPFEALDRSLAAWQLLQDRRWSLWGNGNAIVRSELQVATTLGQTLGQLREFNRLEGHTNIVWSVAYSPDGKYIASSSTDGTVRLWTVHGQPVLDGDGQPWVWRQTSSANSVAFHPSGEMLAIAGGTGDPVVHLVDLQGKAIATLEGHTGAIFGVTYSPDGTRIATASDDKTVRLWTATGQLIREIRGHKAAVEAIVFSPDGTRLATASDDKTLRLWSLAGQELQQWTGHTKLVFTLDFSPDGQLLASGSYDGTVKLWTVGKPSQPPQTLTGHSDRIFSVKFSPNSQLLASAGEDKTIKIWSRTGQLQQTLTGHTDRVTNVAFHPGSQRLASASNDTTVRQWQLQSPMVNHQPHSDRIYGLAISPDSSHIVTGSVDGELKLFHASGTLNRILSPRGNPRTRRLHDVNFHPSGEFVAVVGNDSGVQFWNLAGDRFRTFGRRFADGDPIASTSVTFDPNGERLAIAYDDGVIDLWSTQGEWIQQLPRPTSPDDSLEENTINRVTFSPDGQHIAAAGQDHHLYLWTRNGTFLRRWQGHTNYISDVAFSPDGKSLASAGGDKVASLWTLGGKLLSNMRHVDAVTRIHFHPSGQFLVTGSWDGLVTLWGRNGEQIKQIKEHSDGVGSVQFSPDGEWLNSAGYDEQAIFRHLDLEELVDRSCFWLKDYLKTRSQETSSLNRVCRRDVNGGDRP